MVNENIIWHGHSITKEARVLSKKQKPVLLWFTGLSGSGKSTIANELEKKLFELGKHIYLLDGDNVRHGLNKDLGFSDVDRAENIRRLGEVSKLFIDAGLMVISAFISPFENERKMVKDLLDREEFIEIYVDTPLEVCEKRDVKGLYKKARSGEIAEFTGISSPYEAPKKPQVHLKTDEISIDECVQKVIEFLEKEGYLND